MKWDIKHKNSNGSTTTIASVGKLEYSGSWMGESFITVDVVSPEPINFSIGDYLTYRGEDFYINYDPSVIKKARRGTYGEGFTYNGIKLNSVSDEMTRCSFLDYVTNDNNIHYSSLPEFTFYAETVKDLADRILANMDRLYSNKWDVRVLVSNGTETDYYSSRTQALVGGKFALSLAEFPGKHNINIAISNIYCWDALALAESQFNLNFIIRGRIIYIGTRGTAVGGMFYGKGNGLKEIERVADSSQQIITRLHAYGSEKNMPWRYYASLGVNPFVAIADNKLGYLRSNNDETIILTSSMDYSAKCFKYSYQGEEVAEAYGFYTVHVTKYAYAKIVYGNNETVSFKVGVGSLADLSLGHKTGVVISYSSTPKEFQISDQTLFNSLKTIVATSGAKVYFTDYIDRAAFPDANKDYATNPVVANNLAIKRLMLPGFPTETLDPYLSKNESLLGIREASINFDSDDEENGIIEIYPTIEEMTAGDAGVTAFPSSTRLDEIVEGTSIEDNGIFEDGEDVPEFYIKIRDFGLNMQEALDENKYKVAMKDGMCGAREFSVARAEKDGNYWKLYMSRVNDTTLDLWFPYNGYQINKGDHFVLVDIELPDVYIQAAEQKLKRYAQAYLDNNCYVRYTYTPTVDNIWMQRQHDSHEENEVDSLHDTIKEGDLLVFTDDDLGINESITIDQLSIKEGFGLIPEYSITLKDKKTVGTIQKIQNQINSISTHGVSSGISASELKSIGSNLFLSKQNDDISKGKITMQKGADFGSFNTGISGARVDSNGDAEFGSLNVRESLTVPKLVYNRTEVVGGNTWRCAGGGEIESVEQLSDTTGSATLKLEDGEIGAIAVGDICQGVFHLESGNDTANDDTRNGNFAFAGFKTIYFKITGVSGTRNENFTYELRAHSCASLADNNIGKWTDKTHPHPHMNFAAYGNVSIAGRQISELQTRSYTLLLQNVSSWMYGSDNIVMIMGKLDGFTINVSNNGTTTAYNLTGSGLAFGNAYMWGHIEQLQRIVETFSIELSQRVIQVQMSDWYDEETKDSVTFTFTAKVVNGGGVTVAPTGITLTPPSGMTATTSYTLVNNVYNVTCTIEGYVPESVGGIGAKENKIGVEIMTNISTIRDSIAVISSYEGKSGQDGQDGQDGTSISVDGSSVAHYNSDVNMLADLDNISDGVVLFDMLTVGTAPSTYGIAGSFLCNVSGHVVDDMPTSADDAQPKGTTYVDGDGHMWVAGDSTESWTDCGAIKGDDAVSVNVSSEVVTVKKNDTTVHDVAINVFLGETKLVYDGDGFVVSSIGIGTNGYVKDSKGNEVVGLKWSFRKNDSYTACYRLKLTDGSVVNCEIPYTITYNGVEYKRTISYRTIENGEQGPRGYSGPIARPRGEWDESVSDYTYSDNVRDIVVWSGSGLYKYYTAKQKDVTIPKGVSPSNPSYWEEANSFEFVATNLLLANLAYIKNLGVNNLVVSHQDANQNTIIDGGFCAQDPDASTGIGDYRMWLGGSTPSSATFSVDRYGNLVANKATLKGSVKANMLRLGKSTADGSEINGTVFNTGKKLPELTEEDGIMQLVLFHPAITQGVITQILITCGSNTLIHDTSIEYTTGSTAITVSPGIYIFYGFKDTSYDNKTHWYYKSLF